MDKAKCRAIRKFLSDHRISQAMLSRASTISTSYLSRLIVGKIPITDYQIQRIQRGLTKIPNIKPEDTKKLIRRLYD